MMINRLRAALCGMLALLMLLAIPAQAVQVAPDTVESTTNKPTTEPQPTPLSEAEVQQKAAEDQLRQIQSSSATRQLRPMPLGQGVVRYLFETDQILTMPKNSTSYYFLAPASMPLTGTCEVKLYITNSQTLIEEFSSLTMAVNGTPVQSRTIVQEGVSSFEWDVSFNSKLVRPGGINEVKFTSVQRSVEGECADIDNPSNWVVLHKDSWLRMGIDPAMNPPLSEFLQLYYDSFAEQFTIASDYVLGDSSDIGTLEAMLGAAGAAGMHYPGKSKLKIGVFGEKAPPSSSTNRIYIEKASVPSVGASIPAPKPSLAPGEGYIAIAGVNASEPYYKLLLGAQDREGLQKATAFLTNETLLAQAQEKSIRLKSVVPKGGRKEKPAQPDTVYTLSDLGYTDIRLAGVFHQRTTLSFPQAGGIKSGAGSYVDLHFRHAAALLSDRSQITISINGTQMDSVKLSPGNAQGGNLRVVLPESALEQPVINVDIEVYHYLGKVDCTKDYYDVAWTVVDVDKSTAFFKRGQVGLRPTLKGFPSFNGDKVTVALTSENMQTAAMISARAGQNTRSAFAWYVQDSKSFDKAILGESDLVFLADVRDAALPKEISDALAIAAEGGEFLVRDERLSVIREVLAGKAVVQALRSPWNFYRTAYVLLYDGKQGLTQLNALLATRDNMNRLDGQLCIVGAGAQVQSFVVELPKANEEMPPDTVETYIRKAEEFTKLPFPIIVGIAAVLILLVLLAVRLFGRRKHDEYKQAIEQLKRGQKEPKRASIQEKLPVDSAPKAEVWTCVCGAANNVGEFCAECGQPKPVSEPPA